MHGYGTPIYTNITYPHKNQPPFILPQRGYTNQTETNPVGSYRRDFDLPADWKDREVYLHFDGVYSAMYVWVNGRRVGYSQGANNDAEFNITRYVRPGRNTLAVEVYRWSDGSYLEDQDMFRLSGIHRDVYLYATPKVRLRDFRFDADLSDDFRSAGLRVRAHVANVGGPGPRGRLGRCHAARCRRAPRRRAESPVQRCGPRLRGRCRGCASRLLAATLVGRDALSLYGAPRTEGP